VVSFTNLTAGYFNSVLWEFGDGFVSTQESPLHTYVETGSYSVTLTVSGAAGSDTFTRTSYINTYEPVAAAFTAAPLNGTAPLTVSFTNLSSGDYDTCFWDFGDAETGQACEHPTHIYTTHGVYTVTLSLSGPGGSDSITRAAYVHVYAPPVASFSAMPTTGTPPLDVHFTNLSTGDYDTCLWDFGDGSTSQSCQDPAHVYIATGAYTVSLSLSGPGGGDNETRSEYITVQDDVVIQLPVILKP
jgi:PKD repeat protein